MAKIKPKNRSKEFEVWCKKCNDTIIVEGPKDLVKETKDENIRALYYLVCPSCNQMLTIDDEIIHALGPEYAKAVSEKE